jgi:hypothetical protein
VLCAWPGDMRTLANGTKRHRSGIWNLLRANIDTKDKPIQIYVRGSCEKHIQYGPAEVVSGLYVDLQHVADTGQKSDRQKVAMRPK